MPTGKDDWVIVGKPTPTATITQIWNFYDTKEIADAVLTRDADRINAFYTGGGVTVMDYESFKAAEKKEMTSGPIDEITAEQYDYAFTVLPPKAYEQSGDVERFLSPEHLSGPYTHQYVRLGGRFYTKLVDAGDRATWITAEAIHAHQKTDGAAVRDGETPGATIH